MRASAGAAADTPQSKWRLARHRLWAIFSMLDWMSWNVLERAAGIEPASLAWKARVLPLHNAREPKRPMPTARLSQGMDGARQQLNAVLKPQDEIDSRIRSATCGCKRRLPQPERLCFLTTTGLFSVSHPRGRTVTSGVCIRRPSSLCFQSSMPFERKAN